MWPVTTLKAHDAMTSLNRGNADPFIRPSEGFELERSLTVVF